MTDHPGNDQDHEGAPRRESPASAEGPAESRAETEEENVRRFGPYRQALVRRLSQQHDLAAEDQEDFSQEAALGWIQGRRGRRDSAHAEQSGPTDSPGYAMRSTWNRCQDWLRGRERAERRLDRGQRAEEVLDTGQDGQRAPEPRRDAERAELRVRVEQLCEQLPAQEGRLLKMFLDGETIARVAKELGMREWRVYFKLKQLWKTIAPHLRGFAAL